MQLYNSYTRAKEEFSPAKDQPIKLYVCGVTPYDTTHLGHAFTYVFFDVLVRYLQSKKQTVNYLQNVTDIDDDILKRAKAENTDWKTLGEFWTKKYRTDMKNLNVLEPTYYVKATDSISTIVKMVEKLIADNHAYEVDGNVYFDVTSFPDYGKLSHYSDAQMLLLSKERGGDPDDKKKKHPLDFILWQKKQTNDEPSWDSPWGQGRPGWHIECSAMNYQYLGEQIDIHGGGRDLIYPHHESEIAQSESYTDKKPFSKIWMHTAMVMYEGEKMSKSLGNLVLVSDLLETYDMNTIRYVLLSHNYRTPWEFVDSELDEANESVTKLKKNCHPELVSGSSTSNENVDKTIMQQFTSVMDDDMQTQKALEILHQTAEKIPESSGKEKNKLQNTLQQMTTILGFTF